MASSQFHTVVVICSSIRHLRAEGLFFYHTSLRPDHKLAFEFVNQFLVTLFNTARPFYLIGSWCVAHITIMRSAVCSVSPGWQFGNEGRSNLYTRQKPYNTSPESLSRIPTIVSRLNHKGLEHALSIKTLGLAELSKYFELH